MPSTLAAALLGAVALSPSADAAVLVTGLTANVNDPMSHGTLGDSLLSLDEAIRLLNGTLTLAQLSPAEAAQVTGAGAAVDCALLDPTVTPTVTLQNPLTPITGTGQGRVRVEGLLPAGPGGMPLMTLLLGGGNAHVLAIRSHLVDIKGLHLDGGQIGFDVHTSNSAMNHANMAHIMECDMHGQTVAGLQVHGTGTDRSGVMLHHVHFHQMARGIWVDDQTAFGWTMVECEHVHMDLVALGAEVLEGGQGNMSMLMFFRSHFDGGANFMRVRRVAGSTQQFMIRIVHCEVTSTGETVDVQGIAGGLTMVHHHVSDLTAPVGQKVMRLWPKTADFDFHGTEVHFTGDVSVQASLFTQRVYQQNNLYTNCTITFDCDSSLPNLLWNQYDNCTILVPASARTPVRLRSSELVNCTVDGQSLLAPVTLEGCWSNGSTLTGQASALNPAPMPFLANAEVTPTDAPLGTTFDLVADVPQDIGLLWVFSFAIPRPNTVQEPIRFYGDPVGASVLGGFFTGQSRTTLPMPNNPVLVGLELYMAPVTFPLLNQPYAPALHLPRGGLLRPVP